MIETRFYGCDPAGMLFYKVLIYKRSIFLKIAENFHKLLKFFSESVWRHMI